MRARVEENRAPGRAGRGRGAQGHRPGRSATPTRRPGLLQSAQSPSDTNECAAPSPGAAGWQRPARPVADQLNSSKAAEREASDVCWVILVVILIGVGIWIVSAVLSNTEEELAAKLAPAAGRRARPRAGPSADGPRPLSGRGAAPATTRLRRTADLREPGGRGRPESAPAQRPRRVEQPRLPAARPVSQAIGCGRRSASGAAAHGAALPTMGKRGDLQQQPPPQRAPGAAGAQPPAGIGPPGRRPASPPWCWNWFPEDDENSQVTLPAVLQPLKANASAQPPRPASPRPSRRCWPCCVRRRTRRWPYCSRDPRRAQGRRQTCRPVEPSESGGRVRLRTSGQNPHLQARRASKGSSSLAGASGLCVPSLAPSGLCVPLLALRACVSPRWRVGLVKSCPVGP